MLMCVLLCPQTVAMFSEGAINGSVRHLMSGNVARFGQGGNGELVEAFHSGEPLVIKKVRDVIICKSED